MASTEPRSKTWTLDEYHQAAAADLFVGDRVQLIRGEILVMSPMKPRHAAAIQLVASALHESITGDFSIRVQLPIEIGDNSEPEPDVAVVVGSPRVYANRHPTTASLIVEISDSTLAFDRSQKQHVYAEAQVAEYWIVNLVDGCLEVFSDLTDGQYSLQQSKGPADSVLLPLPGNASIDVRDLLP